MSLTVVDKEVVWALKYRPANLDEIILPARIKDQLKEALTGNSAHLLFSGPPGISKTTSAYAIANELKASTLFVNASMETSIDMLREKVTAFCTTVSAFGSSSRKVVILDECENLSTQAMGSMRGLLESFAKNVLFILTTNYASRVPDPILSRVNHIQFDIKSEEQKALIIDAFNRAKSILENENVEFDPKLVAQVVKSAFPDFRKILTTLQKATIAGVLKPIVLQGGNATYSELIGILENKDWKAMRDWVAEFANSFEFQSFYEEFSRVNTGKPVLADAVILTAKYDYQSNFASSREITIAAFLTELMMAG
jgi:DNA polymerase III delta prime subunit